MGLRLISDGRDLRGRFALAHFAALSFTCFAKSALVQNKSRRSGNEREKVREQIERDVKRQMTNGSYIRDGPLQAIYVKKLHAPLTNSIHI